MAKLKATKITISDLIKQAYGEENGQIIIDALHNGWDKGERDEALKNSVLDVIKNMEPIPPPEGKKPPVVQIMTVAENITHVAFSKFQV